MKGIARDPVADTGESLDDEGPAVLFIDEAGEGVEVATGAEPLGLDTLTDLDDDQMRALFARLLAGCGLDRNRVAGILRADGASVAASLGIPLPFDPMAALVGAFDGDGPDPAPTPRGRADRRRRP